MPFYERAKPLWEQSGLTLLQIADICGISESSASRYLSGKVNPPADIAEKILDALGGSVAAKEGNGQQPVIQQIREIYDAQILAMQRVHAARVAELQRDKLVLFVTVIVLFAAIIYLCADALHGDWGFFRYSLSSLP